MFECTHGGTHTPRTISLIHQQSIGSPEVNGIPNSHVVQVLRHLTPFWVGRVGVLVVHLETSQQMGLSWPLICLLCLEFHHRTRDWFTGNKAPLCIDGNWANTPNKQKCINPDIWFIHVLKMTKSTVAYLFVQQDWKVKYLTSSAPASRLVEVRLGTIYKSLVQLDAGTQEMIWNQSDESFLSIRGQEKQPWNSVIYI